MLDCRSVLLSLASLLAATAVIYVYAASNTLRAIYLAKRRRGVKPCPYDSKVHGCMTWTLNRSYRLARGWSKDMSQVRMQIHQRYLASREAFTYNGCLPRMA